MWLDRPPLNTDAEMLGIHSLENLWQVRATFWLAAILNLAFLAGLLYAVARKETDFSTFIYVYFGILFGSILSPQIRKACDACNRYTHCRMDFDWSPFASSRFALKPNARSRCLLHAPTHISY